MQNEKDIEIYENAPVPDPSIERERNEEAAHAPQAPEELQERLHENTAASPADAGGDIDAEWEEVNTTGEEAVFGSNPTPDQSDVEANAHAMGIDFQDNEPLDILEKMEKRDRDRWELDEGSKESGDMI